ncbi:MAG: serine/threonine protein kinase [Sandaracinaceae bacterium]|nr:serine/threonine protein kinase [Sandaracinaceae bacterium]
MLRKCPHCGARHPNGTLRCTATGRPIAGDPELVGRVVADRYHLVRMLGDGGMGAVYKAADRVLRRFVAIKLLHPAVAENPSSVERFQREARAAAAIGHPNIIDIMDFGREGNRPYMVMEYLRGRSLSQVIAMDGQLSIKRACTIAIHTLAGLQAAHDRGILHRDLKPANLMLVVRFGDRNFVKVCDFGFAALVKTGSTDAKALTPERTLVGTPAYAAPERLRGDDKRDPRLDVYSVGVVLYEMLAGRRPFDAPTFRELARKVRKDPPVPLRDVRPDVPQVLERVVLKALAKDRDERWADAESFAEALFPFGGLRVPFRDDMPSESFTMEMMRIKAREARHRETSTGQVQKPPTRPPPPEPSPEPAAAPSPAPAPEPAVGPPPALAEVADSDLTQRMSAEEALAMVDELEGTPRPKTRVGTPKAKRLRQSQTDNTDVDRMPELAVGPPAALAAGAAAPAPEPAPPVASGGYQGRIVLAVLRFVARKFGERALKELLEAMPEEARRPFEAGIGPDDWVDLAAVRTLVEKIDARLGADDLHLVLEAGRAAAEGAFDLMRSLRPPAPPPELLVAEMPSILQKVVRGAELEVRRVGRGYGRLELKELGEPSLVLAVSTIGFLARSLERFGADDVEVNLLSCRALDDPQTLIDISWFA